jgi:anti-anti-sigma factor
MAVRQFEANVRNEPGVAIIDLFGEINSFTEEALNAAYSEAERSEPNAIILNFTSVDYINSTGIALIVGLLAKARKVRRRLVVYGLSDHYLEIFQITRLADFMNIYSNEHEALADLAVQD